MAASEPSARASGTPERDRLAALWRSCSEDMSGRARAKEDEEGRRRWNVVLDGAAGTELQLSRPQQVSCSSDLNFAHTEVSCFSLGWGAEWVALSFHNANAK